MKKLMIMTAAMAVTLSAIAAHAAEGHISNVVNLRAGPDTLYPVVARITGKKLDVKGCLADRSWCEASWNGQYGWISGQLVKVNGVVANTSFNFDPYWDKHYTNRDFNNQRARYRPEVVGNMAVMPTGTWDRARSNGLERH